MRKRAKVEDKLEKLSVADALPRGRFRRSRRAAARRDTRAGGAGSADRRPRARGRPRAGHRAQQMGRGRECLVACSTASRRRSRKGLSQVKGVPRADRLGQDRQGHRPAARRRVRDARDLVAAGCRPAKLNRWFERAVETNPPPAPGGKRIKLRYITQVSTRPPSFVVFGTRVDQLARKLSRAIWSTACARNWVSRVCRCASISGNSHNPYDE